MNSDEIKVIEMAGRTGRYVSPLDITRLCKYTLQLMVVVAETQQYLQRTAPSGLLKAMVDNVLED